MPLWGTAGQFTHLPRHLPTYLDFNLSTRRVTTLQPIKALSATALRLPRPQTPMTSYVAIDTDLLSSPLLPTSFHHLEPDETARLLFTGLKYSILSSLLQNCFISRFLDRDPWRRRSSRS